MKAKTFFINFYMGLVKYRLDRLGHRTEKSTIPYEWINELEEKWNNFWLEYLDLEHLEDLDLQCLEYLGF